MLRREHPPSYTLSTNSCPPPEPAVIFSWLLKRSAVQSLEIRAITLTKVFNNSCFVVDGAKNTDGRLLKLKVFVKAFHLLQLCGNLPSDILHKHVYEFTGNFVVQNSTSSVKV